MIYYSSFQTCLYLGQSREITNDASVENTNSLYAPDGGYASGRPSSGSAVPETITQKYDADGGYQY